MRREDCHTTNDAILSQLGVLIGASLAALRGDIERLHIENLKAQIRLPKSYEQFDKALRCAELRLPLDTLQSWRVSRAANCADGPCAVCYLPLWEDGQESLQLPCRHAFHFDCLARWLHAHTTCPTCRHDLAGDVGVVESRTNL